MSEKTLFDETPEERTKPASAPVNVNTPAPASPLVLASDQVALANAHPDHSEPGMMQLARLAEGGALLEKAHAILLQVRRQALKLTGPRDWIAMKGRGASDDEAVCLLRNSGARKMRPFFQICVEAAMPTGPQGEFSPEIEYGEDGEVQVRAWCWAHSDLTGERIRVNGRRSSTEEFIGRGKRTNSSQLVARGDLFESLESQLFTKAVRNIGGMKNVPIKELQEAAGFKLAQMDKGSGFGTSGQRGAEASSDIKEKQQKLREELLARTGGDKSAAVSLLKDITIWKGKDKKERWASTVEEILKDYPMKLAWEKIQEHPVFGDKVASKEGEKP